MDNRLTFEVPIMPIPTPMPPNMPNMMHVYNNSNRDSMGVYHPVGNMMGHQLPMPPVEWTPEVIERAHWRPHNTNINNTNHANVSNSRSRSNNNNYIGNTSSQERHIQSRNNIKDNNRTTQMQEYEALEWTIECHPNHWTAALKCSICLEFFNNPMVLPCGHSFCHGCIDELIQRVCRNCPAVENYPRLHFQCPNCRRGVSVGQFLNHAPINVALHSTIEGWKASPDRVKLIAEKKEISCQTDTIQSKDSSVQTVKTKPDIPVVVCNDSGTQTPLQYHTPTRNVAVQTPKTEDEKHAKKKLELNVECAEEILLKNQSENKPNQTPKMLDINGNKNIRQREKEFENSTTKILDNFIKKLQDDKKSKKRLCFEEITNRSNGDSDAVFPEGNHDSPAKEAKDDIGDGEVRSLMIDQPDNQWQCQMANMWLQWTESSSYGQILGPLVLGLYALLSVVMLVGADLEKSSADAMMSWLQTVCVAVVTILFIGVVGLLRFAQVPNNTLRLA